MGAVFWGKKMVVFGRWGDLKGGKEGRGRRRGEGGRRRWRKGTVGFPLVS